MAERAWALFEAEAKESRERIAQVVERFEQAKGEALEGDEEAIAEIEAEASELLADLIRSIHDGRYQE